MAHSLWFGWTSLVNGYVSWTEYQFNRAHDFVVLWFFVCKAIVGRQNLHVCQLSCFHSFHWTINVPMTYVYILLNVIINSLKFWTLLEISRRWILTGIYNILIFTFSNFLLSIIRLYVLGDTFKPAENGKTIESISVIKRRPIMSSVRKILIKNEHLIFWQVLVVNLAFPSNHRYCIKPLLGKFVILVNPR